MVGIVLFQYKEIRNSNAKNDCTLTIAEKELLPENTSLFETQSNENFYEKLQKGKVLLVFIMTDCAACKSESQIISASLNSIASKAKIYGVVREDKEKVKKFIDTNNINFPILIDNDGALFNKLKIKCTPTNLIIEDGLVKKVLIGSPKDEKMLLQDLDISN